MLLNVSQITKSYGPDTVLSGITFRLERREKVAIVGRNGTGKTTLLKILVGDLEPDTGAVQLSKGAKIGYLRQHDPIDMTGTVLDEAEKAHQHALQMKTRLDELEKRLEAGPTEAELEEYATLHEHFLEAEGYSAERDIRTVLLRMGFREEDFDKPASALSGGERTRLALARQILEEPDLLILDEPTNHLDLTAAEWLEGWLKTYPGAVLIVSHDRAFLENIGDRFLELRDGKVKSYPGPFDKFRKLKAEEDARLAEVAKRQEIQIDKLDEFVRRFMNSERTAQARGRLKLMNRLKAEKVTAPTADKGIGGVLAPSKRSGDRVVEAKGLTVQFGDRTLFRKLDWNVGLGERWGVIGDNGTGKSTLIRVILGLADANDGTSKIGSNVEIGYFSQDAEDLDMNESPLEFMMGECGLNPQHSRDLLGRFLITGDDVFRPIRTLSGGERNKLSLARLVNLRPNLLILDEPTNHLDMDSREALAEMLEGYKGTLILVSHDRWLLSNVTNRTLDMKRDAPAIVFPGSYADYRSRHLVAASKKPMAAVVETKTEAELSPREISKEIGRLERAVEDAETQIHVTEDDIRQLEHDLGNLPPDADVLAMTRSHAALKEQLEGQFASWEELSLRLDELRAKQG